MTVINQSNDPLIRDSGQPKTCNHLESLLTTLKLPKALSSRGFAETVSITKQTPFPRRRENLFKGWWIGYEMVTLYIVHTHSRAFCPKKFPNLYSFIYHDYTMIFSFFEMNPICTTTFLCVCACMWSKEAEKKKKAQRRRLHLITLQWRQQKNYSSPKKNPFSSLIPIYHRREGFMISYCAWWIQLNILTFHVQFTRIITVGVES